MAQRMFALRRRSDVGGVTPDEVDQAARFEEELNLIGEQVRAEHPDWTLKQVFDETKRRLTADLN